MAVGKPDESASKFTSIIKEAKEIQVNAEVLVAGTSVKFSDLKLIQTFGEHHTFEIKIAFDKLQSIMMDSPLTVIDLIGREVAINFTHGEKFGETYEFHGVITETQQTGEDGEHGYTLIKGASPTILLERGKRFDVYSEMVLKQIIDFLSETDHTDKLELKNEPNYETPIDFQIQYNESDWEFIKRLCYLYGQNIFYSGSELVIGDFTKAWDAVTLTYDKEIKNLSICSKLLPNTFKSFVYSPENDGKIERESKDNLAHGNPYLDKAFERSEVLKTRDIPHLPLESNNYDVGALDEIIDVKQSRTALQTVYIKGESKTYKTTIGRRVTVDLPTGMSQVGSYGTFLVVKATHTIDQDHHYTNEFEAVPDELQFISLSEPIMPDARSLEAKVVNTNDPKNQGRVKVDFLFKTYSYSSWLRVMTPDAGNTGSNQKNRGLVFIPEVDSHVLVDFQMGNPAYPYVAGALFTGSNGTGGGNSNGIKNIISRSGIQIVFNDNTKSLHIQDASGCTWDMDGNGNITVNAPNRLTFNAKDVDITALNDFRINVGNNLITDVANTQNTFAKTSLNTVSKNYELTSSTAFVSSTLKTFIQTAEFLALGTNSLTLHSDESITANSLGVMDLLSTDTMNLAQEATATELIQTEEVATAVVHFRQRDTDGKLFGFDWLRLKNEPLTVTRNYIDPANPTAPPVAMPVVIAHDYVTLLESGVKSTSTDATGTIIVEEYADSSEAYAALCKSYSPVPIPIIRDIAATPTQDTAYYPARMTIFPNGVDTSYARATAKPKTQVELELRVEILKEINRLELDYDTTLFTISDINALVSIKTPHEKELLTGTITIECLKEFSSKEEIKVWAYPENYTPAIENTSVSVDPSATAPTTPAGGVTAPASTAPTVLTSSAPKHLAGKLIVYPNSRSHVKRMRLAIVSVKTNWTGNTVSGEVSPDCLNDLQNYLHQALIECEIIQRPIDRALTDEEILSSNGGDFILDFTQNPFFRRTYRHTDIITSQTEVKPGRFNYLPKGKLAQERSGLHVLNIVKPDGTFDGTANKELYDYLEAEFDKKYANYSDCYLIFAFGDGIVCNVRLGGGYEIVGAAKDIVSRSAIVFHDCPPPTLGHELLHCLGLPHTFRNKLNEIIAKEQDFVFTKGGTDNAMDYSDDMETLWHSQWERINPNIK